MRWSEGTGNEKLIPYGRACGGVSPADFGVALAGPDGRPDGRRPTVRSGRSTKPPAAGADSAGSRPWHADDANHRSDDRCANAVIGAQSVRCPNKMIDLSWQICRVGFTRQGKTPV